MGNFSILHWIVVAFIIAIIFGAISGLAGVSGGKASYCTTCGHEGPTKKVTRGSFAIELILWLCFIVPGLIYSVWRVSTRHQACTSCGATTLVPPNSPIAIAQKKTLAR
jgi:uncharacterized membrane protein YtjA (UPF0391 family)